MTQRTPFLALIAIGSMIAMLGILAIPSPASAFDLTPEIGTVKPIAPDMTLTLGAAASWRLGTVPADIWLFGGRDVYADLLTLSDEPDRPFMGGSLTVWESTRLGGAVGKGAGREWTMYLIHPVGTF